MRDSRSLIDEVEFFDPPTEVQRVRARRQVAEYAARAGADAAEAAEMMMMLGVHPAQMDEDVETSAVSLPVPRHMQ